MLQVGKIQLLLLVSDLMVNSRLNGISVESMECLNKKKHFLCIRGSKDKIIVALNCSTSSMSIMDSVVIL